MGTESCFLIVVSTTLTSFCGCPTVYWSAGAFELREPVWMSSGRLLCCCRIEFFFDRRGLLPEISTTLLLEFVTAWFVVATRFWSTGGLVIGLLMTWLEFFEWLVSSVPLARSPPAC